jgi:hypothetical protein
VKLKSTKHKKKTEEKEGWKQRQKPQEVVNYLPVYHSKNELKRVKKWRKKRTVDNTTESKS